MSGKKGKSGIYKKTLEMNTGKNPKVKATQFKKGHKGYWKDKNLSEIHKKRLSENSPKIWLGKKLSIETKRKISEAHKGKKRPLQSGEKCHFWKGGLTKLRHVRQSLEYNLWHKAVLQRDNFTCQKTGKVGGKLVAHHINNFADFPELRFAIDNGITLSDKVHIEFHKIYGRKNNTKEQLQEFCHSDAMEVING